LDVALAVRSTLLALEQTDAALALAVTLLGAGSTVITTSLVELVQGALAIVQRSVYAPMAVGVKIAPGELVLLNWERLVLGLPARMLQVPLPTLGALAASVAVPFEHMVCAGPALAAVGVGSTVITTSLVDAVHGLLLTVQRKV
jgi:hypothetical protein